MAQSQQVIEELHDHYVKTASNIILHFKGEKRKNILKELRGIVKKNCIVNARLKSAHEMKDYMFALEDANSDAKDEIENIIKDYKESIAECTKEVVNDEKLIEYDEQVKALLQASEDENPTQGGDDEDLQFTLGEVNVIDPITKKRIVDPVKNKECGHTYDRETVTALLKVNKKTRCPVVGCKSNDFLLLKNLQTDIVLKLYLQRNPE